MAQRLLFDFASGFRHPPSWATPSSDAAGFSQDRGRHKGLEEKEPGFGWQGLSCSGS